MRKFIISGLIISSIITALGMPAAVYGDHALPNRLLSIGSQGTDVIKVQQYLKQLGYSVKVDGFYGLETKKAILSFQKDYADLPDDGVYGPNTGHYLLLATTEVPSSDGGQAPSEDNVNDNLREDKALTYNAGQTGLTTMISQKFITENYDKLRESSQSNPILKEWSTKLPQDVTANIKYDKYPMAYDYFLVTTSTLNIRILPTTDSPISRKAGYFDKINIIQEVKGQLLPKYNSSSWYRVFWHEGGEVKFGYVFSKLGEPRSVRFDRMLNEAKLLQNTIANNKIGYITNYKNTNGLPPAYKGNDKDAYGNDRSQSVPGYVDTNKTDFRYFPDGMIVSVLAETDVYYKVSTPSFKGEYFIPKKYISFKNTPVQLKKVIVIDDTNQNEGVFEWTTDHWELISYSYATTGTESKYSYETPKGHFMAIEKKSYFLYLEDGTTRISGFAPYAIRFSGGGYIHGVPVDFKPEQNQYNTSPTNTANHEEYLFTIGTTPRSHKCVRNFTSHAKFLYDWAEIGSTMVIVIE